MPFVRVALVAGLFLAFSPSLGALDQAPASYPDPAQRVLSHREQNALVTPWIRKRFDTVLPGLMTREGIDMCWAFTPNNEGSCAGRE